MEIAKYKICGPKQDKLLELLESQYPIQLIATSKSKKTFLYIAESYSFLQNSNMSITLFVDFVKSNEVIVNIIVSGGRVGHFNADIFGRELAKLDKIMEEIRILSKKNDWKFSLIQKNDMYPTSTVKFVILDEIHAEQHGQFDTFEDALNELKLRKDISWDQEPNKCPCISWKTCGRNYQIIEYDTTVRPWKEINITPVLKISTESVEWLI